MFFIMSELAKSCFRAISLKKLGWNSDVIFSGVLTLEYATWKSAI
jgi:hypothetical protein